MQIVLASVGSRGDVQPIVAVAQALQRRGHRAVIAAPPDFGPWVRGLGYEFAGMGIDVNAFLQEHQGTLGGNIREFFHLARRMFEAELPAQMDVLLGLASGADAIVFGAGAATAPSVGEKLGIPVLGLLFTTAVLPSAMHAPVTVPWRTLPRWANRLLWLPSDWLWNVLLREGMNAARARHGLAPLSSVVAHLYDESQFVLTVDPQVMPSDAQWRERIPSVGFVFLEPRESALDPGLQAWIDEAEPPIYVGFGSMTGRGPERVQRLLREAIAATGRRALVSRGWAGLGEALPEGWKAIGDTPHALLFPRMACVVHHGGAGTTAAALRAGVPQVLVPLILDQYHHAQLLHEHGLAPRPVPMEKISGAQLADSIRAAMALPRDRREALAKRLQASRAADAVAERLEAAVRRQRL